MRKVGLILLGVLLTGCDTESTSHDTLTTKSICPSDSTLTYATFGKAFMENYCTRCHSSTLEGAARHGAPSDHDFNTLANIHATELAHIDAVAAAGPAGTNTKMPTSGNAPTQTEREQLGTWIACGAP
jgi:hypothetical protein